VAHPARRRRRGLPVDLQVALFLLAAVLNVVFVGNTLLHGYSWVRLVGSHGQTVGQVVACNVRERSNCSVIYNVQGSSYSLGTSQGGGLNTVNVYYDAEDPSVAMEAGDYAFATVTVIGVPFVVAMDGGYWIMRRRKR
jgi:hypothetical protein